MNSEVLFLSLLSRNLKNLHLPKRRNYFSKRVMLDDERRVMDKEAVEVDPSQKGEGLTSSHGKTIIGAFSLGSTSWIRPQDPRIVRVSRAFGGKDRHSKVCTIKGLRDRRVRLSVPTAIQLYDLQDRLGLSQPSKVVDWLLDAAKHEIDELPPLPLVSGTNFVHSIHHPRLSAASHDLLSSLDGLERSPDDWKTSGSVSKRNIREAITQEHVDECRHHDSRKGSRGQRQERDSHGSGCNLGTSNDMPKWPHHYNDISQEVFPLPVPGKTAFFLNSISVTPRGEEVRKSMIGGSANEIDEFPLRR